MKIWQQAVSLINSLTNGGADTDRVKFASTPFASQMYGTFDMSNIRTNMQNSQGNTSASSTWTGCFGDREYSYSRNDTAPSSSIAGSGFGERTASNSSRSSSYGCSSSYQARPFYRLTNDYMILKDAINAWTTGGGTDISLGTAMGWHQVSPNAPFGDGVSYDHNETADGDDKVVKVVVILTDGVQTRRAEGSSSYSSSNGNPNTAALCTAMKAQDIVVITIEYDLYSISTLTMLENCASEPSSKYFFNFNVNGSEGNISDAFDATGQAISNMVYLSH